MHYMIFTDKQFGRDFDRPGYKKLVRQIRRREKWYRTPPRLRWTTRIRKLRFLLVSARDYNIVML